MNTGEMVNPKFGLLGNADYTVGRFMGLAQMVEDKNQCWNLSADRFKEIFLDIVQEYRKARGEL